MAEQERKTTRRDASTTDAPPATTKAAVAEKGEKLKKTRA